uniref:Uncharacterized protein n=1 Tax=Leptobrachium leishanense TaxID=445787 RepID=A0A8C5PCV9_9ANUR
SKTCGKGTQTRRRQCDNPPPAFDGLQCDGPDAQMQICNGRHCPVDGRWSLWSSWTSCSLSCGGGIRQRTRECSNPAPLYGGHACDGNALESEVCNSDLCPGKFCVPKKASDFTGIVQHIMSALLRVLINLLLVGSRSICQICSYFAVHGNWGLWSPWGTCSRTCNGGQTRRYRTCDNPAPSHSGRACAGADTETQKCNVDLCPGG